MYALAINKFELIINRYIEIKYKYYEIKILQTMLCKNYIMVCSFEH